MATATSARRVRSPQAASNDDDYYYRQQLAEQQRSDQIYDERMRRNDAYSRAFGACMTARNYTVQ